MAGRRAPRRRQRVPPLRALPPGAPRPAPRAEAQGQRGPGSAHRPGSCRPGATVRRAGGSPSRDRGLFPGHSTSQRHGIRGHAAGPRHRPRSPRAPLAAPRPARRSAGADGRSVRGPPSVATRHPQSDHADGRRARLSGGIKRREPLPPRRRCQRQHRRRRARRPGRGRHRGAGERRHPGPRPRQVEGIHAARRRSPVVRDRDPALAPDDERSPRPAGRLAPRRRVSGEASTWRTSPGWVGHP